ncbi:MAG: TM2 domain-containing protein [Akkermansiaceae bacterium]|jgi:TM2 domain-containing membrane protein YozV|nr:TM2 domain-containing protein [Akkermansiaceae bacterium]
MSEEQGNPAPQPSDSQPPAPSQGAPAPVPSADKKVLAGILSIFLGGWGIHKFVLGYTKEGIIMLIIGLLTCWIFPVMCVIGIIEGIIYLTKSDEEFVATYVKGRRGWF